MSRSLIAALALAGLMLSGCATAIPQALDPAMTPKAFAGPTAVAAPTWPDAGWWSRFGDPQLTSLIAQAQSNNRDVAVAAARVRQSQAQVRIEHAALFPQAGGQASYANGGCSGLGCQSFPASKAFSLAATASYQPDVWGLAGDNVRAAGEQLKAAQFTRQAVALAATANVADQYFTVLAIRQRIAIAHENIEAINSILAVIELRVKTGASSHLDLAREQAQLEAVQAQLPTLETGEQESTFALAILLGRPPEGFDVSSQDLTGLTPPPLSPGLPSDLLLRRPDVAQAEAGLAAAHANLDAARAAFLPQISLTSAGGLASGALGSLLSGPGSGYNLGAQLMQTLFDGGRLAGQKDLADAGQQVAVAQYQGAVLAAFADVEDALIEGADARQAQDHLRREVTAARQAFQISQLQYRQGATDLLNVLQAQQTLFSAEDDLAQASLAGGEAAVHLYQALGGGWTEPAEARTQFVAAAP